MGGRGTGGRDDRKKTDLISPDPPGPQPNNKVSTTGTREGNGKAFKAGTPEARATIKNREREATIKKPPQLPVCTAEGPGVKATVAVLSPSFRDQPDRMGGHRENAAVWLGGAKPTKWSNDGYCYRCDG